MCDYLRGVPPNSLDPLSQTLRKLLPSLAIIQISDVPQMTKVKRYIVFGLSYQYGISAKRMGYARFIEYVSVLTWVQDVCARLCELRWRINLSISLRMYRDQPAELSLPLPPKIRSGQPAKSTDIFYCSHRRPRRCWQVHGLPS